MGVMFGLTTRNQILGFARDEDVVELHDPLNNFETLLWRESGKLFQEFGEAHAEMLIKPANLAKPVVKFGQRSGTTLARSLPRRLISYLNETCCSYYS